MWLSGAAASIWALATVLRISALGAHLRDEHISLAIALLVYAIGYRGLRQPEVFRHETSEFRIPEPPAIALLPDDATEDNRYERSGLNAEEASALEFVLRDVMDRAQPWKDSDLTLPDLAARLDTTPHKLSEVLNARMGLTFYDFVNGYRVRDVQRRIEAGDAKSLKILALAMDAGFASKSTFNHAFKKHTSQTPSGFRKAIGG